MAEILPGIHQVEGVDPSPDFSTHVYLAKDAGPSWTLIDAGLPGSEKAIGQYLAKHKIEPRSVRQILITHLHNDHTGALRELAKLTGARTYAHWIDAAYIEDHPKYEGKGMPPSNPFSVHERLKDGDRVDAAGGAIVYHTPGHTPGHASYYLPDRRILFSGDLFFGLGAKLVLTTPEYSHDLLTAGISARRVATLPLDALLTYHGGPFPTGARALVERLAATL
jgi:glyoxylase-like metal-dependent hydrolase (beta-lactamase superfamily II)